METERQAMLTAHMNPNFTSMTIDEVPHKRLYPKELRSGMTIAVHTRAGYGHYYEWKTITSYGHSNQNFRWNFSDGTHLRLWKKLGACKFEVLI